MSVPTEVESLIDGAPVSAHLATSVEDRPHVAPVWYGYRDGVVYFLTGGRKLSNVRQNPRVALSIEKARGGDVEWNVTLLGRARVEEEPERIEWASGWIYDAYDGESDDASADDTDESATGDSRTDGGESAGDADDPDYALVAVDVGSSVWNVYG